jgi:hypothetical protein
MSKEGAGVSKVRMATVSNDGHSSKTLRRPHRTLGRLSLMALTAALALASSGCVGTVYAFKAASASSKLEQAKTLGAEELAEYEYYFAKEHMEKASEEAAQAEYGDAIEFADVAGEYADKAIELSRGAHRGAGR